MVGVVSVGVVGVGVGRGEGGGGKESLSVPYIYFINMQCYGCYYNIHKLCGQFHQEPSCIEEEQPAVASQCGMELV